MIPIAILILVRALHAPREPESPIEDPSEPQFVRPKAIRKKEEQQQQHQRQQQQLALGFLVVIIPSLGPLTVWLFASGGQMRAGKVGSCDCIVLLPGWKPSNLSAARDLAWAPLPSFLPRSPFHNQNQTSKRTSAPTSNLERAFAGPQPGSGCGSGAGSRFQLGASPLRRPKRFNGSRRPQHGGHFGVLSLLGVLRWPLEEPQHLREAREFA